MDTSKPRILTAENIYPGVDPITRRPNAVNAHTFVEVFSEIISWLKSRDLEKYIQDPEGKLIQPKDKQQKLLKELEESTLNEFYNSIRAQKWNGYYDRYVNDWPNKTISIYLRKEDGNWSGSRHDRIPRESRHVAGRDCGT